MYVNVNKIPFQLKVLRKVKNSHFYEFCRENKLQCLKKKCNKEMQTLTRLFPIKMKGV